ncbi:MAG: methionine synthase [bacterium]
MKNSFLPLLEEKIVVFDGAMGTSIQKCNLSSENFWGKDGCNEYLVETNPKVIEEIHASFLEVGCDVIETNTFGATSIVLAEYELEDKPYDLNLKAAQLAKLVASDFSQNGHPRYVAGSIGPTTKLPSLGHISFDDIKNAYYQQVSGLVDGGVDILLVETCQDILQAKAALVAIFEYFEKAGIKLPVMAQITVETTGTMLLGTEVSAALVTLAAYDIDIIGMNCATGPAEMSEHIRVLSAGAPMKLSCLPNAGIPENRSGEAYYKLRPKELALHLRHFAKDLGVNIVGGCCGTTPAHLAKVVEAVKDLTPKKRDPQFLPSVSSLYTSATMQIEPPPVLVGERTNANGSKMFRELLLADNFDAMVTMAKKQVKEGAHLLDVCVAYVGRDEKRDMIEIINRFNTQVTVPLMIDTTEPPVVEEALKRISGKAIVNSVNLEDGEERIKRMLLLCKKYGAAVIALTIDEEGMAKTAQKKFEIAKRIYELAVNKYGLRPEDLIVDTLTFTLGSGDEEFRKAGNETIEALRLIKENLTKVKTILGVSNISFGLSTHARIVLNSVFLHYAIEYGLDMAIVNAKKILPLYKINVKERELCRQLIFDNRKNGFDPLVAIMEYYSKGEGAAKSKEKEKKTPKTLEEALKHRIIDGEKQNLEKDLDKALEKYTALEIINKILLDGMRVVGDLFGSGEMQLPFVLQSAEVMKAAVQYLEPFMEKSEEDNRGTLVIATVKSDVHDIGKNLVDIILTNNGYRVVNLGISCSIETMINSAAKHKANALGMSGLLVKSTVIMKENLEVLNERDIKIPVILGGAALTRRYVEEDLRAIYKGQLAYGKDAFSGLHFMEALTSDLTINKKLEKHPQIEGAESLLGQEAKISATENEQASKEVYKYYRSNGAARSDVKKDVPIPKAPFYGTKIVTNISLDKIFPYINKIALIRGQWQVKRGRLRSTEYEAMLKEKIYPKFEELKQKCKEEAWLQPKVVYGYFHCQSEGDDLIVYKEDEKTEWLRFNFPRQTGSRHLCLADFFASKDSGKIDVIALHAVTVGKRTSEISEKLFKSDNYTDYLFFHGLSVETTEALAEYWHQRIRLELGIADSDSEDIRKLFTQHYQGSRYSFGYPACPNLADQLKLFELLKPERIDIELTETFQLIPEQSTTAIIVHHPEAKYFNIK